MTSDRLSEGIHEHRLSDRAAQILDDPMASASDRRLSARAIETTRRIGERTSLERERLVALLREAGVPVEPNDRDGPRQNHAISLAVSDHACADRAAELLEPGGYERWERWARGAAQSFRRVADHLTLGRTTDVTMVARIAWSPVRARTTFDRLFRPTAGDWDMIDLPERAWPAYSLVRPMRLLLERTPLLERHNAGLGPYLSTPESLIGPLLEFASLQPTDRFVDVGCGDGRLAVAAASSYGCQVVGIERSAELAAAARARAERAAVSDLVDIRVADARSADLSSASVVFMFLPINIVDALLAPTLEKLPNGARLIVHEQSRLPSSIDPPPDHSSPILGDEAVTVAHRWTARRI
ncbi:MAG: class I SAM-dependent methyltransferase [Acidimicrobiia bacterium]|nr:class I SAM-dependent methyltransferase [Acidimicrobiia bacterium]